MRILALADIHGELEPLRRILARSAQSCDVIAVAGDIVRFLTPHQFEPIASLLTAARKPVIAVAGNCDGPPIDRKLTRLGWNVCGHGRILRGLGGADARANTSYGFCGLAGAPAHHSHSWAVTDAEVLAWTEAGWPAIAPADARILLSHAPPAGATVANLQQDGADSEAHKPLPGSPAVRQALDTYQFDLAICGHIHQAQGTGRIDRCLIVSCGAARDGRYAVIEAAADRSLTDDHRRWSVQTASL